MLVNFRPAVTVENWRIDCGVAAYDNGLGLPPFFPTRLRFEDYIYRLWVRQQGIASAHVDAAQTHTKSNYMRNPLPAEVFDEEIANFLKRKILESLVRVDELGIEFGYEGHVSAADTDAMLEKITRLHGRVQDAAAAAKSPERRTALERFAVTLEKTFYGLDPDFFHQNVSRIVDDVVSEFRGSLELWPTLVEIGYLQTHRAGFPRRRVENLATEA